MAETDTPDSIEEALRVLTGNPTAEFRDGQREAIAALSEQQERVLVVQRTGWGKSAVYFVATSLLRQRGFGPTLLISPLLALMRNQIEAASRLGLRSMTVNSSTNTTVAELTERLDADEIDLVLVSPERLANPEFAAAVMPVLGRRPGLVVIDEVHCISDWGHDFRPDYRRIGRLVAGFGEGIVPVLGCTATANDRVVSDVAEQLGTELTTFRGPLGRDGLALGVLELPRQVDRLAWLAEHIGDMPGSGIVYCLTVRDTELVADWLRAHDINAAAYSGATEPEEREALERKLQGNEIKVLVATTALGMGYDKPDLGFVIHYQMPGSPVAYYQQVGRAGRALDSSRAVLLKGHEDTEILDYFIAAAFPAPESVDAVLAALNDAEGAVSLRSLTQLVDLKQTKIELILKQLDVHGAVRRVKSQTFERTLQPWSYPTERVESVTAARQHEQQLMFEYVATEQCRMKFLTDLLDDPTGDPCGVCDNCTGNPVPNELPLELVQEADAFLRRRPLRMQPKKLGIPAGERIETGRVLCRWGDAGWSPLVESGKHTDGRFDDELVAAVVDMIGEWRPDPAPEWVTAVPSTRSGGLVEDFAARLAVALQLPFHDIINRIAERPQQRTLQNSAHQRANVRGAFSVTTSPPASPGLLVDDLYDSGWTMAEVGAALRRAGAGPVYPVALGSTTGRRT
ncbi:MAG: RecQ family ATP-dependent DNA helicase [Actinobacteria bacterium]|nr:RecQ family ATP-dependent DNA helicase [Actinomycetota bacterium]